MFNVNEKDRIWVDTQCTPHPTQCFLQKLTLTRARERVRNKAFIRATGYPSEPFDRGLASARAKGWRVYEMASGHRADDEDSRFGGSLAGTPPVPTTAIFSRTDGICAWQGCMEKASATSESIEVESSHCGMGHHPAAVYAVADRLAQPEGQWAPFDRGGWRALVYPNPNR